MSEYTYTEYFEKEVLRKRPYLKKEWCIQVIENPIKVERQEHNRMPSMIGGSNYETKLLS